ncbi:MAG: NADH-quinone oxidoreductase subunit L, partial [Proteobacteria bacterium]|nr:NADH-quinone oxidoreductase subunit L [Pseudomonadota bacterium]
SYLLIGFWYTRETAIYANLKAFLVNRVGDFGFALGIAAVLMAFNTLNYGEVFGLAQAGEYQQTISIFAGYEWSMITVMCILLFVGAMGKSAQFPLHVWLPDSMEGPTPISALIHAATMVTAGIFMVARMSPLFELSTTALSFVLIIGAITAFFMGLLGLVQHDIKRVVAYSTLSQLGYMTVALGASAYTAGMFHLMTHAFFKALLFLGAGSVIIAMHHEQDMRKMGGLKKYMPITYITMLIGSLALIGFPGMSGFFSKDAIIEAVHHAYEADRAGAGFAYYAVLSGVFITALYTFRMFFLTFHGKERMDEHTKEHLHESPNVVTWPLIALAIPSIFIGMFTIGPMLFGNYFSDSIFVAVGHNPFDPENYHGAIYFMLHGLIQLPVFLAAAGVGVAYFLYIKRPELPAIIAKRTSIVYKILVEKYYLDRFNDWFFAGGTRKIGSFMWQFGDVKFIDGFINGMADLINWTA